jgi:hypothetical protein
MFNIKNKNELIKDVLGLSEILKMCRKEVQRTYNTCNDFENKLFLNDSKDEEYKKTHIIPFNLLKLKCFNIVNDINEVSKGLQNLMDKEFRWARDSNDLSILDFRIKEISIKCSELEHETSLCILKL